jgi:hypothetical protein
MLFSRFVAECFEPGVLPTLKFATQLMAEESKWKELTRAVARIMWPAKEG